MTTKEEYNKIVNCIERDVEAMRAHKVICWKQYLDAKAILSNPNFNNLSVQMLRNLAKLPGNTEIQSPYLHN